MNAARPHGELDELHAMLLHAAVRAPSMHNTQPWLFRPYDRTIEVYRDPTRELPLEDPDGRATLMSHGAVCLNLRVAAAHAGHDASVRLFPDRSRPTLVARVTLRPASQRDLEPLAALYPSIRLRRSNRMPYADVAMPEEVREALAQAAELEGAALEWVRDRSRVTWLLRLASDAQVEDAFDPARVAERLPWIGGERDAEGIPSEALAPHPHEPSGVPVRDFLTGESHPQAVAAYERDPSLAVLVTRTDEPIDRVAAGMALERVWLTATKHGLAVSLHTGAVEHSSLRWLIRDPRAGWSEPQAVLRIGYGPAVRATPRRPLTDFLLSDDAATG